MSTALPWLLRRLGVLTLVLRMIIVPSKEVQVVDLSPATAAQQAITHVTTTLPPSMASKLMPAMDAKATKQAAKQLSRTDKLLACIQNALIVVVFAVVIFFMFAFRHQWFPIVWKATLGSLRWPNACTLRNYEPCSWLLPCCFPCCFPRYHERVRLRVMIVEAFELRNTNQLRAMQVFCLVRAGDNPVKSTSTRGLNAKGSVLWNDAIDIIIEPADDDVVIQVVRPTMSQTEVIGTCHLKISEFFFHDRLGDISDVITWQPKMHQLLFDGNQAGKLHVKLFCTRPEKTLPAMVPGMDMSQEQMSLLDPEGMSAS
eukprot:gnl/TRDRNA2_/TRDRNA2_199011_c0_seq1.p1 gnl/TRDRNA2_/TRDRNA2_199011_c0~~gnl/TRDRNA2_/TRDRNA2_199011_c0_seq1.p1  ORF type:complete len:314 (+),score=42.56 gnl/TRDRNA2_/TRDRNA2_199011_c0_seq1:66-1007(+)